MHWTKKPENKARLSKMLKKAARTRKRLQKEKAMMVAGRKPSMAERPHARKSMLNNDQRERLMEMGAGMRLSQLAGEMGLLMREFPELRKMMK